MLQDTVRIDGSVGEGGGQMLRSSLSLAALLGRPLAIENIRARRQKPGLLRQHLTAVRAIDAICGGVDGATLGARALRFTPGRPRAGSHHFAVGSAGSAVLVCQTVLPVLLGADGPSEVVFEGGTHNPMAPPFEFLDRVFFPALREMGVELEATLDRAGFYPAGGGRFTVRITPAAALRPFTRLDRAGDLHIEAWALSAHLPEHVGARELAAIRDAFDLPRHLCRNKTLPSPGPGNAVLIELRQGEAIELVSAFGEKRRPAEHVAADAIAQARTWLEATAPVGEHLADQLLLPMALAGGAFRAGVWSLHAATNVDIIRAFLGPDAVQVEETPAGTVVRCPGVSGWHR
ncbi:MAG: RNA 3'-terminal phosphate cyclase [Myxococcales bacterium]|nr:RNA 3'-terminal phosphate cyclase [Myxococcales bacterium]